jgi:hypothetical protein
MRFLFDRQPSFFAIFFDSEKMKSDVKTDIFLICRLLTLLEDSPRVVTVNVLNFFIRA